jgi:zinc protease
MAGAAGLDRTLRPPPGPAPRISLPSFERFRLDNGLSVLAIRRDRLPEVSARLVLPCSAVEDRRERAGTALLVARALTEGTVARTAPEVAEWLDYLGARFSVRVDNDSTVLSLRFLSRVLEGALELLAEVVAQPAFAPKEVERLRDERLDEIARGLDEPRTIAGLRFAEASFDGHPYGIRAGGVEETVRAISAEELREFHARFFRPEGATLILVGDLPGEGELGRRLETAFEMWRGAQAAAGSVTDPEPLEGRKLWAVAWPGPQSELRVGGLGIARTDPDYAAVMVMNAILGGLFSSRINMNLREDKGWTYGASSRFETRKRRGPYYAATAVEAGASVAAVREILAEMERMKREPASDEELKLAKNSLTLSLPRLFETPGQISSRIAQQVIYGLPDDYWETYADEIRAVTRDDVGRVAERLLDSDRIAIVVVGPVRDFASELEKLGPLEFRDVHGRPAER